MMFELWYRDVNLNGQTFVSEFEANSREEAFERWVNFRDFSEIIGRPVLLIELKEIVTKENNN